MIFFNSEIKPILILVGWGDVAWISEAPHVATAVDSSSKELRL